MVKNDTRARPGPRPAGPDPADTRWALVAFGLTLVLYARTLAFQLVWDDVLLIVRNPSLSGPGSLVRSLLGSFWGAYGRERAEVDFYRPVASVSMWLDRQYWGHQAPGFHLTNVLLAAAGAALLYRLLRSRGFEPWAAGAGALFFAACPLHVESVPFVADRTDLLCLDFSLAFLLLWGPPGTAVSAGRVAAALGAWLLALGSKELALAAAVVPLWEAWLWRRENPAAYRSTPRLAWLLLPLAAYAALRHAALAGRAGLEPLRAMGSGAGAALQLYGRLLLWPFGASAEYVYPPRLAAWEGALGIVALAALAAGALWARAPRTLRWACGLCLLFTLPGALPGLAAARYLYFASAFSCAALAALLAPRRGLRGPAGGAVLLAFCAATFVRLPVWHDNLALFQDTAARQPGSARAWINLGVSQEEAGRLEEAESSLRTAVRLDPGDDRALSNLSLVLKRMGAIAEAESLARRAVALEPENLDARFNLASVLYAAGRPAEAAGEYRRGLAGREDPGALLGLAIALSDAGDHAGSLAAYRRYLAAVPADSAATHGSIAWELYCLDRVAEAEREARTSVRAAAAPAVSYYNLGAILLRQGKDVEALESYRRGLAADSGGAGWASGAGDVVQLLRGDHDSAAAHFALGLFAGAAGLTQAQAREGRRIGGSSLPGPWGAQARGWALRWDEVAARREAESAAGRAPAARQLQAVLWGR